MDSLEVYEEQQERINDLEATLRNVLATLAQIAETLAGALGEDEEDDE